VWTPFQHPCRHRKTPTAAEVYEQILMVFSYAAISALCPSSPGSRRRSPAPSTPASATYEDGKVRSAGRITTEPDQLPIRERVQGAEHPRHAHHA